VIHGLGDVAERLNQVRTRLKRWSMDKLGVVTKELNVMRSKLEEVNNHAQDANQMERQRITRRMDELLYREEIMWLQ
jgi:hypothetical protein